MEIFLGKISLKYVLNILCNEISNIEIIEKLVFQKAHLKVSFVCFLYAYKINLEESI